LLNDLTLTYNYTSRGGSILMEIPGSMLLENDKDAPRFGNYALSTKQAAELLDCSPGTVLSLIHKGVLKGQKKRWSNQYEVQPLSMLFYVGEYTPDQLLPEWNKETGTLRAPLDMTLEKWEECQSKYGDTDYEWNEEKRNWASTTAQWEKQLAARIAAQRKAEQQADLARELGTLWSASQVQVIRQAADLLDIRLSAYVGSIILRESMATLADARALSLVPTPETKKRYF